MNIEITFQQTLSGTTHEWQFGLNPIERTAFITECRQGSEHYSSTVLPPTDAVTDELNEMGYELIE